MGNGAVTPWNVLSGAISKRVKEAREKHNKAEDEERQNEFSIIMEGIKAHAANGTLTDDMIQQAQAKMQKLVPKESHPLVDAFTKVMGKIRRQPGQGGKGGQKGQGGGGPGQAKTSQAAAGATGGGSAAQTPTQAPAATSTYPSATQRGTAAGQEQAATEGILETSRRSRMEALIKDMKARGIPVTGEQEAELLTGGKMAATKTGVPKIQDAPTAIFGPGGQFRGIKDPKDPEHGLPGHEYLSRAMIPPDRKDLLTMWDAGKAEEKKEQDAEIAKERRRAIEQADMIGQRVEAALRVNNYKQARKAVEDADKLYQDSVDRMSTMDANLKDVVEGDAKGKPNQQAMLSLVANHIGMTLGAQRGARITRAVWDEATASAPWLERLGAKWSGTGADAYLTGVVLTREQSEQMVQLGHEKVNILRDRVGRVKESHKEDLALAPAVPPKMKGPGKDKGAGADTGTRKVLVEGKDF
jgi:hypothetical protein